MVLLLGAFVAGVLTTLAPCVLPLLPVIVGGSLGEANRVSRRRAYLIVASLGVSVTVFTLLLRATTALIDVPTSVWQWVSGGILIALGIVSVFPSLWDQVAMRLALQTRSQKSLIAARKKEGAFGAVLTGSALGPVFTSCSPLYGYVIVTVLPASFWNGMGLLLAYVIGLCGALLLIALLGQRILGKIRWISDPDGGFRKVLGLVFVLVGLAVILGLDKELQTWIIEYSPIRPWELDSNFIPGP